LAMIQQLRERTYRRLTNLVNFEIERIASLRERPVLKDPSVLVTSRLEIIQGLRDRSHRSTSNAINMAREELVHLVARVRSLSPQSTLDRGYAVVQRADGTVARDPLELHIGEMLRLRLARGDIHATVSESGE
jgi:exodeoxyribonuclease VII large subunit